MTHLKKSDKRWEFLAMDKYCKGLGLDYGCGTNRFSPSVLCTDWYPHKGVDLVWNCVHEGGRYPFPFAENTFDFIFASHVIEDFRPEEIQFVFDELLRMIKPGGYFCILGPCMDGVRYPLWDEKFTAESPEVISGERQIGEQAGNPSHYVNWDLELCHKLKNDSAYKTEVVQENTFPDNQMTIDFVIKKL